MQFTFRASLSPNSRLIVVIMQEVQGIGFPFSVKQKNSYSLDCPSRLRKIGQGCNVAGAGQASPDRLSQRIHFCPPAHHVGPWAPPQGRDVSAHHHRRPQQEGRGQAMEPRQGARKGARAAPRLAATGAAEPSRQAPLGPQPSSLRVPGQPPCPRGSPVSLGDAPRVGGGLRLSPAAVA